jgi:hypothetical protein
VIIHREPLLIGEALVGYLAEGAFEVATTGGCRDCAVRQIQLSRPLKDAPSIAGDTAQCFEPAVVRHRFFVGDSEFNGHPKGGGVTVYHDGASDGFIKNRRRYTTVGDARITLVARPWSKQGDQLFVVGFIKGGFKAIVVGNGCANLKLTSKTG